MNANISRSKVFYVAAVLVLCLALASFTGWVSGIYDGSVATVHH